jgi:hypothetical protein
MVTGETPVRRKNSRLALSWREGVFGDETKAGNAHVILLGKLLGFLEGISNQGCWGVACFAVPASFLPNPTASIRISLP